MRAYEELGSHAATSFRGALRFYAHHAQRTLILTFSLREKELLRTRDPRRRSACARRSLSPSERAGCGPSSEYATFVAIFRRPRATDELEFENLLWQQLRRLHELDAAHFDWDPDVRSDPADPHFSFSFGGQALYVIGMHANSSREARRFPWPALVFNPHEQFERLRADGKWKRMQETIRARDLALQGTINPMLSDFGEQSEARQYSGRAVEENWQAPFKAVERKCPFAH